MNGILQALFALLAALSPTTGGVQFVDPAAADRPAIVRPTTSGSVHSVSTESVKAEIRGTIQTATGNMIKIDGQSITIDKGTQVKVRLAPGTVVIVEGVRVNGQLIAKEIKPVESTSGKSDDSRKQGTRVQFGDDKGKDSDKEDTRDKSGVDDSSKDKD